MTFLYAHPFTFDVRWEDRELGGWTFDCGQKRDYDPTLIRFSCRVYPDGDYCCSLMLGEKYLRRTEILRATGVGRAKAAVELWCAERAEEVIAALAASGMETASADETVGLGPEGDSPTGEAGDAQGTSP
jgi:hypothetical protein